MRDLVRLGVVSLVLCCIPPASARSLDAGDLSLPGDQVAEATGPSGAQVSYGVSDPDPSVTVACAPSSGSVFPLGATTVQCSGSDGDSGSFTVTIHDTTPPAVQSIPGGITAEAKSPQGSAASYATPTAVDLVDGPRPVTCSPASGSTFALGTDVVSCQAADSHGNTGSASFSIHIVDTTAPTLVVPGNRTVHATSATGYASSYFTRLAQATDIADPHPSISNDAPDVVPVGTTKVTFTATDTSGNHASGSSVLTVLPADGTTPVAQAPDVTPPDDVGGLTAGAGDGLVVLTWKRPTARDFASVIVTRTPAAGGDPQVVYRGSATTFTDRGVDDGVAYRYVVVALDSTGNASTGAVVIATPKRATLRAPRDGARLRKPPKLSWLRADGASYYNLQLFRGTTKLLSAWPKKASFRLRRSWRYGGRSYRLTPGAYRWYVWPGFGTRADANYGDLLGTSSFQIIR